MIEDNKESYYLIVSTSRPCNFIAGQFKKMTTIGPIANNVATTTFHARSNLALGLYLLITYPELNSPMTVPTNITGPEKCNEFSQVPLTDINSVLDMNSAS